MRLTQNVKIVLLGILDAVERTQVADLNSFDRDDFEVLGVSYAVRQWLGRDPTHSEEAMISRTVKAMEKAGLLERNAKWGYLAGNSRTTHVKLTDAGEKLARRIRGD